MSTPLAAGVFYDFDTEDVFKKCEDAILSQNTQNFVVEFNNSFARCALNVGQDALEDELSTRSPLSKPEESDRYTRWINVWAPETQKDLLTAISDRYGFSPRLLGLMADEPMKPKIVPAPTHQSHLSDIFRSRKDNVQSHTLEKGSQDNDDGHSYQEEYLDLNHYQIVDEVWHYSSVDWGSKFLCIGYNSLHQTSASLKAKSDTSRRLSNRPSGQRVWTWLVLCDDRTVITVNENIFPYHFGDLSEEENKTLKSVRHNLKNVFSQLSAASTRSSSLNPVNSLPLRSFLQHKHVHSNTSPSDVPSLLFYYLFDDWYTSYSLVARREHQYGSQLEQLRARMFMTADLKNVDELHHYGRQLAVLKRMYQSYDNVLERILEGPHNLDDHDLSNLLSTSAQLKFLRLRDRVKLLALTEIQDCLDEKEALVQVNFNLIAMKESSAVENLTRITILLAKVTIVFMPVSLMTAYFSVQLSDIVGAYTRVTYWCAFAVVMTLSILFLVIFGKLSGTQEAAPIYRSLTRVFYEKVKTAYRER